MAEKKALMFASVASMIDQFNIPNIQILQSLGYKVDVAANFSNPGTITAERADDLIKRLKNNGVRVRNIGIPRSFHLGKIFLSYKKVRGLIVTEHYDLVHCHSPIGGAICRMAAKSERKKGTKVIYTAHGFHFYTGAPLKNWILFYPVEKMLSRYTDVLITINKEDCKRAKTKFHAKKTVYVPGVGVDTEKFGAHYRGVEIRKELGIGKDNTMLLSVGELNENKNHETVIRAMTKCKDRYCYTIVGQGRKREQLEALIRELELEERVKLVGYRNDVADFYDAADVFVFPSYREGLPVSLMEAMASGLPVVCSRIRGNTDLMDEGKGGYFFDPLRSDDVEKSIEKLMEGDREGFGLYNSQKIKRFDLTAVQKKMKEIYFSCRIDKKYK